jgi:hypothetical protein
LLARWGLRETISAILLAPDRRTAWSAERHRKPVQQANLLTSDKVAAMFLFHPVGPLVTRKEVDYPPENRITDLMDLDLVTVSG